MQSRTVRNATSPWNGWRTRKTIMVNHGGAAVVSGSFLKKTLFR
ncbi:MAG: hypothetical protein VYC00_01385 [Candidatus Neomarinimicrobiota bacterium]|nr:hypothetical protein [Candidatus Neomarinimicrobiota bacterium]